MPPTPPRPHRSLPPAIAPASPTRRSFPATTWRAVRRSDPSPRPDSASPRSTWAAPSSRCIPHESSWAQTMSAISRRRSPSSCRRSASRAGAHLRSVEQFLQPLVEIGREVTNGLTVHARAGAFQCRRWQRPAHNDVHLAGPDDLRTLRHHALAAAYSHGHDGHLGLDGEIRGAVEQGLHDRPRLPLSFREDHDRLTRLEECRAAGERLAIDRSSTHRKTTERREQPPEELHLPQRVLAHVPHPAFRTDGGDRCVHVRTVDRREHERAIGRHVLAALNAETQPDPAEADAQTSAEAVEHERRLAVARQTRMDRRHLASPTISSTMSSMSRSLVSMMTAPSTIVSGPSARPRSLASRSAIDFSMSRTARSSLRPISNALRCARTAGVAVK